MKYIKINTPLQVVGGFSTAEAILVLTEYKGYEGTSDKPVSAFETRLYKSFEAYNQNEERIQLKNELPNYLNGNHLEVNDSNADEMIDKYLSVLKTNEYDAEIVDTDEKPVLSKAYIVDKDLNTQKANEEFRQALKNETPDEEVILSSLNNLYENLTGLKSRISNTRLDFDIAISINQLYTATYLSLKTLVTELGLKEKLTHINRKVIL